jgi:hypothetical protein
MNRRIETAVIVALLCFLLLANGALAMSSTNYRLDWIVPLTSGGGGHSSSAHYAVDLTIGQTAVGTSSSTHYNAALGYWYGIVQQFRLYLPLILR